MGLMFVLSSSMALALACRCAGTTKMAKTCPHRPVSQMTPVSSGHCDPEKKDEDGQEKPQTDAQQSDCCGDIRSAAAVDIAASDATSSYSLSTPVYQAVAQIDNFKSCFHSRQLDHGTSLQGGRVPSILLLTRSFLI